MIRIYLAVLTIVIAVCGSGAFAWRQGTNISILAASQLGPQFPGIGGEYKLLNLLKESVRLSYVDVTGFPAGDELDSNGYPLYGGNGIVNHGGITTTMQVPSQAVRPGNYVLAATGAGTASLAVSGGTTTLASCSGVTASLTCNNQSCTAFTGSISGQILTVSIASSCSLVVGLPISNANTIVNQFGVPTIITGKSGSANCPSCTGTGGVGTYLVNWPQTIASSSINPGLRLEIAITPLTETTTTSGTLRATITAVANGNVFGNMSVVFVGDEALYAAGQLTGVKFAQRVRQGNFAYLRDLNTSNGNISNVTTWATRKPASYISYQAPEMRPSLYVASSSYALNGSSNDYSVNLGGAPVDKQIVCFKPTATATSSQILTFSIDNGVTKYPMLEYRGSTPSAGFPRLGDVISVTFDAFTQSWLSSIGSGNVTCLNNGIPPEAFVQMNIELGTSEWVVEPFYGADPITDYPIQYALYIQKNHPTSRPVFEIPDETFNCSGQGLGPYASFKSLSYINVDTTWNTNKSGKVYCGSTPADINNWTGKVSSLLAQAIRTVSASYEVAIGVQGAGAGGTAWNANVLAPSYVGQNASNIPTQSGCAGADAIQTNCPTPFLKSAPYLVGATIVTPANYWTVGDAATSSGLQAEVALAYCYFYQTAGCASQASLMTTYMNTTTAGCSACITGGGLALDNRFLQWFNFAKTCAGGSSCTPLSVRSYEGGYSPNPLSSDQTVAITAATNAANAQLTAAANGGVVGMSVKITAASGGTWSTVVGNTYTVTAVAAGNFTINLDSTGLGTLSSATVSYVGSSNYITYFRLMSELSPDSKTNTALMFTTIATTSGACAPFACSTYPSLFNLSSTNPLIANQGPNGFSFDIYGYFPLAACTSCTASGTNLTLGGTVTGIFTPGLTVMGKGMTLQTITSACSKTGSGPAGSNAGDVCPLSASASVAVGVSMTGNATPGTTRNPVTMWQGYCDWNGNGAACNIP